MLQISSKLNKKAIDLHSMTIDNPSGRTSKKTGEVLKATVYFTGGKVNADGKWEPNKKSKLYTPVQDAAPLIEGCECEKVITLTVWHEDTQATTYRFLDKDLDDSDREEIDSLKASTNTEDGLDALLKALAKLTNAGMMKLPEDKRKHVADFIAAHSHTAVQKLLRAPAEKKVQARIRLWK